jgi:hypothetical protein
MKSLNSISRIAPTSVVLLLFAGSAEAVPITFDVVCASNTVGVVKIDANGKGISGSFGTTGNSGTLAAAAAACGEDHFNWYQIITADNQPPKDRAGNQLAPPYVDVPPNGYDSAFDTIWADNLPWYLDEYAPPAGTPNFVTDTLLSSQTTKTALDFSDFPGGGDGLNLSFMTWLVSLNADSSFHSFHGGFSWDFSIAADGTNNGVTKIATLGALPTNAEYQNIIGNFATKVPEPPIIYLLVVGGLSILVRRRRSY